MFRLSLALLMLLGSLHAQPGRSPEKRPVYKLEGTVLNAQTGDPIPRALVETNGFARRAVLTDANGHFVFEHLPETSIFVSIRKPGFFPPGSKQSYSAAYSASIRVGPDTPKLEVRLAPECVISGDVIDSEGEPVENAYIEILRVNFSQGHRALGVVHGTTPTDEDGRFRIAGLAAGSYYVAVKGIFGVRRLLGESAKTPAQTYPVIVYYPSAASFPAASPVNLIPGQRIQLHFSLAKVPAFKLSGTVTNLSIFKQATQPAIIDETGQQLFSANRWNGQTGDFAFPPLPAGTYTLAFGGADSRNLYSRSVQTIVLDRDRTDVKLAMAPGARIPIIVHNETDPQNQNNCSGEYQSPQGEKYDCHAWLLNGTLSNVEPYSPQVSSFLEGAKDNPAFVFDPVSPGRYIAHIFPATNAYIASVRSGGIDLLREELVVPSGGNVSPIEVVLRDDGGTLKVRVHSDTPIDNGRILMFPEFARLREPVMQMFQSDHDMEYRNLPPGPYKVMAFDSLDNFNLEDPAFYKKYSSKATQVTLSSHGTSSIVLDVLPIGGLGEE